MNVFQSNGAVVHYRASGALPRAKTLVFINSLGTDFRIWDGVAEALSGSFNLVMHDKRGHGLSGLGDREISIGTLADDVENLLKHLAATNVVLVGLSIGGLIAQELMQRKTVPITAAVLSNTGLKIGNDDMWNSRIAAIEAQGLDAISHGVMERWFSPQFRTEQPHLLETYRTMLVHTPPHSYLACCRAIRDAQSFDHRVHAPLPTLCIGGSLDGTTPPNVVKAMAAQIPAAKYHEFEGTGHLPCIEQPLPFAQSVAQFLSDI
jgi:3-oxoadipate enol-lactonase